MEVAAIFASDGTNKMYALFKAGGSDFLSDGTEPTTGVGFN